MPTIRPLNQQELAALQSEGYDVSKYNGAPVDIEKAFGTQPQQTTALGAGARSAAASAIPTAAGGAGFAAAMGLLAPETMGASLLAIPVAAGAGYLASKLASKGQEAVMPESWKQSLATAEQEHPVASRVGSLATLPLGGFRLDPAGLERAAMGLPKLFANGASIGERQALINAAASGTLGGIQEAVMAPMEGREITPGNVALNALIGATHTAPSFVGKAYGFKPSIGDTTSQDYTRAATLTPEQMAAAGELRKPSVEMPEYAKGPEQLFGKPKEAPKETIQDRWNKVLQKVYLGQDSGLDEYVTGVSRLKGVDKGDIENVLKSSGTFDKWITDQPDYIGARFQPAEEGLVNKPQLEVDIETKNFFEKKIADARKYLNDPATRPEEKEDLRNRINYYKQQLDPSAVRNPAEMNQQADTTLTPEGTAVQSKIPENVVWTPAYQKLINPILERHGFAVSEDGTLLTSKGEPAKGVAISGKVIRTVINPNLASLDTPIHEGFHGLQFLAEGGNKQAAALLTKLNRASEVGLKQYNELRALAGKEPMTMEEFTATQQGFEFVKQAFNLDKETKWGKWWNDTKALFKTKYGEKASVEDLRRAVNYRMVNDPLLGGKSVNVAPGVARNADEGLPQPEKPILGGAEKDLPPEQRAESERNNAAQVALMKKELGIREQPATEGLQQNAPGIGNFRPTEASADTVSRKVDKEVGQAFHDWRGMKDRFTAVGTTANKDLSKLNFELVQRVEQKMAEAYDAGKTEVSEVNFTPEEQAAFNILSPYYLKMRQIQNVLGLKIDGREATSNPFYIPRQLNDQMLDLFTRKSTSPEAMAQKRKWAQFVADRSGGEISFDEALDNILDFTNALGGARENYNVVKFGAIRKAAGYGLPDDMRELNPLQNLSKYNRRAANDLAVYSELESKPEIADKLGLKDPNTGLHYPSYVKEKDLSGNQDVRNAMKWVTGNWTGTIARELPLINAVARSVNSALLGTPTGIRNVIQVIPNMVPYIDRWSDLGAMWRGFTNLKENRRAALETGATVPQIDKLMMNDIAQSPDRATALFQKGATLLRKWQGVELLENFQRDLTFSIGKELATSRIIAEQAGDKSAARWLDKFGLLVDKPILELLDKNPDAAINTIAKNFVDRNQGTYSGSGLPAWMQESQFAPFLALQKWSIEKSNVIYQDVFKPFMTGENRLPMLTYALGTFLTGAAIQKLNELITNRKGQDPTWQEALDSGDPKQIAAELATLMQLSSYAGIVSDGLKFATDLSLTGKTPRNIVSFPAATAILNLEQQTRNMAEALRNGENPWEVLKAYTLDLAQHQVQLGRVLLNHTMKEEDIERSDKFRDLRVWNELNGAPVGNITQSNPYLGINEKRYKRTGNIGEAASLLPEIVQHTMQKAGNNPEKLRKSFASLSGNSYQTFPSFEQSPMGFQNYYQFLLRTQGQEIADERMSDYIRQSTLNKIKSSLVPRF